MADKTITQLPAASSANANAVVAADNAAGTLTEKVTLGQIAALASSAGYDQSLNTTDNVTFNALTLAGEAVVVSGITNEGDGYIAGIMGWGDPSGTQWSDLNGTYLRTAVAVRPAAFSNGQQGMHTPEPGTFNYYLANPVSMGYPNPGWNGIAYFLAPGNRSGWGADPDNDATTDPPVNYWRLVVGADWPYTYFTNPSTDATTFPLSGWVPVSAEAPTPNEGAGGNGADYLPNYDGGFTVADAGGSGLTFVNGTQVTVGTFDIGLYGNGGVSLVCAVGYQLNWQASHLRNVFINDTTGTPLPIYCDSPIEFPGEGTDNVEINADGIKFADGTTLTTADDPRWDSFLPNPPTGVAGEVSGNNILLSWSAPAGGSVPPITDYTIQYSDDDGATWTTFADIVSDTTSATITGLTSGNEYKFRVRAVNAIGLGALSAVSDGVTLASPGVTLLLHFDGADEGAVFTNSAYTPLTITPYDAMTSTDQSKFGGASGYFDDARLTVVDDDGSPVEALSFGTGQFTVDFWVHVTGGSTYKNLLEFGTYGDYPATRFALTIYPNEQLQVENFAALLQDPTAFPTDEWVHVAVTRDSASMMRLFINGVVVDSDTVTQEFTANIASIGKQWSGESFTGWMDELRVVKGECLYTANFTPPTQPYADPVAPGMELLLHMDGANESTTFTDSSANALTVTPVGEAAISTTQSKFGGASAYFGGGDHLAIPYDPSLSFGNEDFTIEWNMYWVSGSAVFSWSNDYRIGMVGDYGNSAGDKLCLLVSTNGSSWDVFTVDVGDGQDGTTSFAAPKNQWCHVAITRNGTAWRIFIDGVEAFNKTASASIAGSQGLNFHVGGYWGGLTAALDFVGYIDEFRILKGYAAYTANFTPPTQPHSNPPPPPALLLHMDGANESTTFTDSSANALTVTAVGGAEVSTAQSKFGGASCFTPGASSGSSLSVDGDLAFGTGDFTVEAWLRMTGGGDYPAILEIGDHTAAAGIIFLANAGGAVYSGSFVGTGLSVPLNQWVHVAWVREGGVLTAFVNGIANGSASLPNNFSDSTTVTIGNRHNASGLAFWDYTGYIDELRIIKGYAAYTTNFTPPTAPF